MCRRPGRSVVFGITLSVIRDFVFLIVLVSLTIFLLLLRDENFRCFQGIVPFVLGSRKAQFQMTRVLSFLPVLSIAGHDYTIINSVHISVVFVFICQIKYLQ